jgi:predicted Fe-Mo cluster-binding NifX family protein
MRVAVSALEPGLEGAVDEQFGRAAYFVLVDPETLACETIENAANRGALHGAGIASAELVAERGAQAVLTSHLGPNALQALEAASIPAYAVTGTSVRQAVEAFAEGKLERLDQAVAPGFGGGRA